MHAQIQPLIPFGETAAAATQVVVTITGQAGRRVMLGALHMGFSAAAPTAPVQATVSDGVTTMEFAVGTDPDGIPLCGPLMFAPGATVTITLPSGGGTAVGNVSGGYYFARADEQ